MLDLAHPLTAAELADASRRIAGHCLRTPLVERPDEIHLKLEALQPFGSYKIRGAVNVIAARLEGGPPFDRVVSASAGNFGQALTAAARAADKRVTIHVPDNAAQVKVEALRALGATVVVHSFADWWEIMQTRDAGDAQALFIHPVCEREVIAGAGTIGLELLEDMPRPDIVLVPLGGGGLITGIADVIKAVHPQCRVLAVEAETATPLTAAFAAGAPVQIDRRPSFIDGMGSGRLLDAMWPRIRALVDGAVIVTLDEVAEGVRRLLREHHVLAEGAGAAAFAAAGRFAGQRVAAIVSGGNIDAAALTTILAGRTPRPG